MARKPFPSDKQDQFMVRFPDGLRERIKTAAKQNGRSMNAEIVSKLERYDALGGEVDAIWEVARALAAEIDEVCGFDASSGPLVDKINEAFVAVDEFGNVDRARLGREYAAEAAERLIGAMSGTISVPSDLLNRISARAAKNGRSADAEIMATLEREYPAPADVMHVHLDNIRHALDLYERETDPQARMRLQSLVEAMVTSGDKLEVDWDEDGEA